MPRISVVVPIYNVEGYLAECLDSVQAQTVEDLEVVLVDDGSTDGSAAVAESYAARDRRFRLVQQANGGLSKARNTGIEHVSGEYLAFLDSDDVLPPNAYELLLGALEETGSDFASGNVHRLHGWGTVQSPFLARAFARTRLKTHVSRDRPLLADRVAWNKLWRRSFWGDRRFPEGVVHEDIPVILPAHFQARSVDVLSDTVYLWRTRDGGQLSITQRRLEPRVLLDRLAAIQQVCDYLDANGPRRAKRWYHESVVADDLSYHLNILDSGDEDYRNLFLDRVNAFLDGADRRIFDPLPAIDRLKWHLVRQRLTAELLEVLRFEREDLADTPPVRVGRGWYGDYPFRTDERLRIPREVYRVDRELTLNAHLEELAREGDALRVRGFAYIGGIGAPARGSQTLSVGAVRPGRLRRLRLRTTAKRLPTVERHTPEATARAKQALANIDWAGFEATLDPRTLRGEGTWELFVHAKAGGLRRRRARFNLEPFRPLRAVDLPGGARAATTWSGRATVEVRKERPAVHAARLDGDVLELHVSAPKLELVRRGDERVRRVKVAAGRARVKLAGLEDGEWVLSGVSLAEGATWPWEGREVVLSRTYLGEAAIVVREPRPVLTDARWTDGGELELTGRGAPREIVLVDEDRGDRHAFAVEHGADGFSARLTPAAVTSLAGTLPLAEGTWQVQGDEAPAMVDRALFAKLPLSTVVDHKPFALGVGRDDRAVLVVQRDLDLDERGGYHQRRLRETAYGARRAEPLRDAVVYTSFGGRQYSDSPRAIHEELVRRGAPLEHLWVVRDARCRVPESATALREDSREYHEALAQARYVITNDHFPEWFARRPDQVCVQTWHGTPLKRIGLDVSGARKAIRRFQRRWDQQKANWQYVVSPNRFSTPILERAYAIEGEMLETGYPRVDVLARPDREERTRALRERLGLPADRLIVLYAPTYRDQVRDRKGRYRLDLQLDLERLRGALGDRAVILFRKHHYVADAAPSTPDGFVRDVSSYPDGTELMLAADVLVTDYSSMMVDFANTGRPMLFYTYDLDAYREEIRGFYLDFVETVPGPLLRTTDELAGALLDLEGMQAAYAERYAAFRETFCELDDGGAAARVVERTFSW